MSNAHVWRAAQDRLRQQMTRAQFDTWLRGTWLDDDGDGATVLCVRTTFARELLETRFRERIEAAIAEVTGKPCHVRIAVALGEQQHDAEPAADSALDQTRTDASSRLSAQRATHRARPAATSGPSLFEAGETTAPAEVPIRAAQAPANSRLAPASALRRRAITGGPARLVRGRPSLPRAVDADGLPAASMEPAIGRGMGGAADADGERTASSGVVQNERAASGSPVRAERMERFGGAHGDERAHAPRIRTRGAQDAHDEPRTLPLERSEGKSGLGGGANAMSVQLAPPKLNPRYLFSTFIVGSANQLAHAASQAVAEAPGRAYNPLFLYGGVGLGKTHLLHAIGHTAIEDGLAVLYVSSETFTNEIINAIRFRTTEEFRAKYRSVDVLLVDDIQFIAGKDSTEEEFFHTFNALYENNKQIVVCSDRPPKAIVSLAERLRSRFEWGLIADIQPPDLETRVAILRAKSDSMGRHVPDEVLTYLANRVQSNIRELEGSFNRLFAVSQLQGLPLTIETAKAALANLANDSQQRRVSVAAVLEAVAEYYRIPIDDLCGKQRDKHIVVPRQVAMYLMREETEASLLEVGQALGGRDHSTVLHGVEKITRELNDNTTLRKDINAIRQQLLG